MGAHRTHDLTVLRVAFAIDYCRAKGWPLNPRLLTPEQVREVRSQPGWKNPSEPD